MISGSKGDRIWTCSCAGSEWRRGRPERIQCGCWPGPVHVHGNQFPAANARFHQAPHRRLARRVLMTDRIHAHDSLRSQRAIEQVVQGFRFPRGARQAVQAEMAGQQLVGLQHAGPLADGHEALVEGRLESALRGLAAAPGVILLHPHIVVEITNA